MACVVHIPSRWQTGVDALAPAAGASTPNKLRKALAGAASVQLPPNPRWRPPRRPRRGRLHLRSDRGT